MTWQSAGQHGPELLVCVGVGKGTGSQTLVGAVPLPPPLALLPRPLVTSFQFTPASQRLLLTRQLGLWLLV